jgi:hypothetical protein
MLDDLSFGRLKQIVLPMLDDLSFGRLKQIVLPMLDDLSFGRLKQIVLPMLDDLSFGRLKQIKFYKQRISSYNTQGTSYTPDGLEHVQRMGADCRRLVVGAD